MSATLARLMLSMAVIAGTPVVWVIVAIWLDRRASDDVAFLYANIIGGLFLITAWTATWSGHVTWDARRVLKTAIAAAGAVALVVAMYVFVRLAFHRGYGGDNELGLILGGLVGGAAWPAFTAFAWRETAAERAARLKQHGVHTVACPTCGYNLTGLTDARCPECGSKFTLDQLLAHTLDTRDTRDGVA